MKTAKRLVTVCLTLALSLSGAHAANATTVNNALVDDGAEAPSATQALIAIDHLSLDARSGKYIFDDSEARSAGLPPRLADQFKHDFESLSAAEVAIVNAEIGVPTGSSTTHSGQQDRVARPLNKAHCDRQYARDSARCQRIPLPQGRALYRAAAVAQYANCLR